MCNYRILIMDHVRYKRQGENQEQTPANERSIPVHPAVPVETDKSNHISIPVSVEHDDCAGPEYLHVKFQIGDFFHSKKKPSNSWKCDFCDKEFATNRHLRRHMNVHTRNKHVVCDLCQRTFVDKSSMTRHLVSHTGEKPYKCTICVKSFGFSTSLKRHMTLHDVCSRVHSCLQCGKRFPDKSGLLKHSLLHSGKKSHICKVCSKPFYHVGDLNLHMKSHDPVKPFHCDVCGKSFSRHNNMARHRLIHSGAERHMCDVCGVCFQHVGTLTRHILASHPLKKEVKRTMAGPGMNSFNKCVREVERSAANLLFV